MKLFKLLFILGIFFLSLFILPSVSAKNCKDDFECGVVNCVQGKCQGASSITVGRIGKGTCNYNVPPGRRLNNCCVSVNDCDASSDNCVEPKCLISGPEGGKCDYSERITECLDSDKCCPSGCNYFNDKQCPKPKVIIGGTKGPSQPSPNPEITVAEVCGNGIVVPPEECDGGHTGALISLRSGSPPWRYVTLQEVILKGNKQCIDSGKGTVCKDCRCISEVIDGSTTGGEEGGQEQQTPSIGRAYDVSQEVSLVAGVIGILLVIGLMVFFVKKQK